MRHLFAVNTPHRSETGVLRRIYREWGVFSVQSEIEHPKLNSARVGDRYRQVLEFRSFQLGCDTMQHLLKRRHGIPIC
jgi:hypothetical protein